MVIFGYLGVTLFWRPGPWFFDTFLIQVIAYESKLIILEITPVQINKMILQQQMVSYIAN